MLATQVPPLAAGPAGIVRSGSGPRPNTSLLPSGIAITRPDGAATCAAAGVIESSVIAVLPYTCRLGQLLRMSHTYRCPNPKSGARGPRIPESGDGRER